MPTPTTRLRAQLIDPGSSLNVWGQLLNDTAISLLDEAIAGVEKISLTGSNGALSLTSANYASDQARNAALIFQGSPAVPVTVTIPAVEKVYAIVNQTGQTITITAGGVSVAMPAGDRGVVWCDGTDCGTASISAQTVNGLIANAQLAGANLPGQAGHSGEFLQTDGAVPVWSPVVIPDVGGGADATITTTTTLAVNASVVQSVNMATDAQSVKLPAATSLTKGGRKFVILNVGNRTHGVRDNAGTLLTVVPAGGAAELHLRDNTTAAGSWGVTGRGLEPALTLVDHTAPTTVTGAVEVAVRLTDTLSIHFGTTATGFNALAVDNGAGLAGAWTAVEAAGAATVNHAFRISDTQAIVFWTVGATQKAGVLTVDPATRAITVGTAVTVWSLAQVTFTGRPVLAQLSPTLYVYMYNNGANVTAISVNGATVTVGAAAASGASSAQQALAVYPVAATTAIAFFVDGASPYNLKAVVLSVSGTTVTVGTAVNINALASNIVYPVCQLSPTKYIVGHGESNAVKASLVTVSGTSVSASSGVTVEALAIHPSALTHGANRFQPNLAALDANRALFTYGPDQGVPGVQTRHVVLSESGGALTAGNIIYSLFTYTTGGDFPQSADGFLAFSQGYPNSAGTTYYASEQAIYSVTAAGASLEVGGTFQRGDMAFSPNPSGRFGVPNGVCGIWQDYETYVSASNIGGGIAPVALTRRGLLHLFKFVPNGAPRYLGSVSPRDLAHYYGASNSTLSTPNYFVPVGLGASKAALTGYSGPTLSAGIAAQSVRVLVLEFAQ